MTDPTTMHEPRLEELRRNIRGRLHGVCGSIPEEQLVELVDRMARVQHKYEHGGAGSSLRERAHRPPTLRAVRGDMVARTRTSD